MNDSKSIFLGSFDTAEEAAGIYCRAAYYLKEKENNDNATTNAMGLQSKRNNSSDKEEDWESIFKELCEYKRQLGHANPKRSVPQLGEWAYRMRKL